MVPRALMSDVAQLVLELVMASVVAPLSASVEAAEVVRVMLVLLDVVAGGPVEVPESVLDVLVGCPLVVPENLREVPVEVLVTVPPEVLVTVPVDVAVTVPVEVLVTVRVKVLVNVFVVVPVEDVPVEVPVTVPVEVPVAEVVLTVLVLLLAVVVLVPLVVLLLRVLLVVLCVVVVVLVVVALQEQKRTRPMASQLAAEGQPKVHMPLQLASPQQLFSSQIAGFSAYAQPAVAPIVEPHCVLARAATCTTKLAVVTNASPSSSHGPPAS